MSKKKKTLDYEYKKDYVKTAKGIILKQNFYLGF